MIALTVRSTFGKKTYMHEELYLMYVVFSDSKFSWRTFDRMVRPRNTDKQRMLLKAQDAVDKANENLSYAAPNNVHQITQGVAKELSIPILYGIYGNDDATPWLSDIEMLALSQEK